MSKQTPQWQASDLTPVANVLSAPQIVVIRQAESARWAEGVKATGIEADRGVDAGQAPAAMAGAIELTPAAR